MYVCLTCKELKKKNVINPSCTGLKLTLLLLRLKTGLSKITQVAIWSQRMCSKRL